MYYTPLAVAAVVITMSTTPIKATVGPVEQFSAQEKQATIKPLVQAATQCIAQSVATDARFKAAQAALGDLIVSSVSSCALSVRAMISAYDNLYGDGSGEAFFVGPYLNVLPTAVDEWIKNYSRR
jgi:hypothetical protein